MKFEKIKTWFRFYSTFSTDHSNLCNRPNGNAYLGMYARLLALSVENNGIIFVSLKAKLTETIATLVNESDIVMVRKLISILYRFDYMEKLDNGSLFFREAKELSSSETAAARRMRKLRQARKNDAEPSQCYDQEKNDRNNVTPCSQFPPYKNNINNPPKASKDAKGISKDIPNRKNIRTNNKKRTCTCETPSELVQWLVEQGYISTSTKEWVKAVSEGFETSYLPILVRVAAERVVASRSAVKDKLNYFKRTLGHIRCNPEEYVEGWEKLVTEHRDHIIELTKIAKTPWLTDEKKEGQ